MRVTRYERLLGCLAEHPAVPRVSRETAYEELKRLTGQDFGYDVKAWRQWFKDAEDPFPNKAKRDE